MFEGHTRKTKEHLAIHCLFIYHARGNGVYCGL